mmetsp:Transcript_5794/g.8107  ORF Transcript_5794/g.8107 Transcript_5794/m.8107 type:complete len:593 (+) Transcript_5794:70-1848(+)
MDDLGYSPVSDDSDKVKEDRKRSRDSDSRSRYSYKEDNHRDRSRSPKRSRGRSDEIFENTNLFVNFIPPEYRDDDLYRMFSPYGEIVSTKLMVDLKTHESKCFGFVKFKNLESAKAAIAALHDSKLTERRLVVKYAEPKGGSVTPFGTPSNRVFLKGLPPSVDQDRVKDALAHYGVVVGCELYTNDRGEFLGRATVTFDNEDAAARAIDALNERPFPGDPSGERLKVRYEDTENERETRLLKIKRRRMLAHKVGPPSPPHDSFRSRRDDPRDDRHRSDDRHRHRDSHEPRDRYSDHPPRYDDQERFPERMPSRESRWPADSGYHSNDRDRDRYDPHPSDRKRFEPPRDNHRDRFGGPPPSDREPSRFPEEEKRYVNDQSSRYYPDKDIRDFRDDRRGPPEMDNRPPYDRYGPPEHDRYRPREPDNDRYRREPEPMLSRDRDDRPSRDVMRDDRDRMNMHRHERDMDRGGFREDTHKRDFRDDRNRMDDRDRRERIRDRQPEETQRDINPDCNLFVYNLPSSYTDADLYKLFREFGPIASVRVMTEPVTGQCKGFGFVEMATADAALQAIQKMHGSKLYGKELQVSLKKDKPR